MLLRARAFGCVACNWPKLDASNHHVIYWAVLKSRAISLAPFRMCQSARARVCYFVAVCYFVELFTICLSCNSTPLVWTIQQRAVNHSIFVCAPTQDVNYDNYGKAQSVTKLYYTIQIVIYTIACIYILWRNTRTNTGFTREHTYAAAAAAAAAVFCTTVAYYRLLFNYLF